MTKTIVVSFTELGTPVDTLSPTIKIRNVSTGVLVISSATMTSIGNGGYKYDFVSYDKTIDYYIFIDGGNEQLDSERYAFTTNANEIVEITDSIWDELNSSHLTPGTTGYNLYQAILQDKFSGYGAG